ncbi:MAG: amidohydrolase family protein [Alphaproteobacteria bacterium]|nr:amidohydrolase family protein [Alphaproteobacteria bacterium]
MDLIVRNVRLSHRPMSELVDIGVADGKIVALERGIAAEAEIYDAGGRLACGGLVETHIHLDKSRILDRAPPETGRRINPMKQVAALKRGFTVEDIRARAERTLIECVLNGATRMRTQVEVDPAIGLRGFEGVQSLIAEYRWAIDIEICVFPQDGLTNYPGTDELLVEALKRGVKAIGGAPRYDTDHAGQIRRIFELAREFDVDIDIHLDVGDTPEAMDIPLVCELTEQYRRGGRVVVGHMAKLSTMPPDQVASLGRRLADTGVAVTVLPLTDLFVMGRDQDHNVRRGVADANFLVEHGVNCSLSTNNVLNPVTPYGDCSLIRMANLHANVLQIGQPQQLREIFAMLTERSARLLNLKDYGIIVGHPADIVVIDADSPQQAVAEIRHPVAVFKRGRQTVKRAPPKLCRPV